MLKKTRLTLSSLLISVICLIVITPESESVSINVPTSASEVNSMVEYILFTDSQSWNTARKICRSISAVLAVIDSEEKLDKIAELAQSVWSASWSNDVWTGLHRNINDILVFDDSGCSAYNVSASGTDIFRSLNDYNGIVTSSSPDRLCYVIDSTNFVLKGSVCSNTKKFICQKNSGICPYSSVDSQTHIVPSSNASSCQSLCSQQSGCYLTARYNSHCVLLSVPGTSSSVYQKDCVTTAVDSSNTNSHQGSDDNSNIPTPCVPEPFPTASSTSQHVFNISTDICPVTTISNPYAVLSTAECLPETITVSPLISIHTVTEISTHTPAAISAVTMLQVSATTLTQTSTATVTQSEIITETVAASVIVNYITETTTPVSVQSTTITTTETSVLHTCDMDTSSSVETPGTTATETSTLVLQTCDTSLIPAAGSTTVTTTETSTEVLNSCDPSFSAMTNALLTSTSLSAPYVSTSYVTSTEIQVTSTFLLTSMKSCPSYDPVEITVTPLCPESTELQMSASLLEDSFMLTLSVSTAASAKTTVSQAVATVCTTYNLTHVDMEEFNKIMSSVVKELTLDTKNLSSTVRKKTSAQDPRPSSQYIGLSSVFLVIVPILVILFFDAGKVFQDFRHSFENTKESYSP